MRCIFFWEEKSLWLHCLCYVKCVVLNLVIFKINASISDLKEWIQQLTLWKQSKDFPLTRKSRWTNNKEVKSVTKVLPQRKDISQLCGFTLWGFTLHGFTPTSTDFLKKDGCFAHMLPENGGRRSISQIITWRQHCPGKKTLLTKNISGQYHLWTQTQKSSTES